MTREKVRITDHAAARWAERFGADRDSLWAAILRSRPLTRSERRLARVQGESRVARIDDVTQSFFVFEAPRWERGQYALLTVFGSLGAMLPRDRQGHHLRGQRRPKGKRRMRP